jgi:hypothetical protein
MHRAVVRNLPRNNHAVVKPLSSVTQLASANTKPAQLHAVLSECNWQLLLNSGPAQLHAVPLGCS